MGILRGLFRTPVSAKDLADLVYILAMTDSEILKEEGARYSEFSGFQPETYEKLVFVYRVASVAIALTNAYESQPRISRVIEAFRDRIRDEMAARWGYSQGDADEAVEDAAGHLGTLLFSNPAEDRGRAFDWTQNWLKKAGVEEFNPVRLLEISAAWNYHFLSIAEFLSKFRVSD